MAKFAKHFGRKPGRSPGGAKRNPGLHRPREIPDCAALHPGYSRHSRALLLGTALASGLIALPVMLAPAPAMAQVTCAAEPASPAPIEIIDPGDSIDCYNNETRMNDAGGDAIKLETDGNFETIDLYNGPNGTLTADYDGIDTETDGIYADITIENRGRIDAGGEGIQADTDGSGSDITIDNYARIDAEEEGIEADTDDEYSDIDIGNSGNIFSGGDGINADTDEGYSYIDIRNTGDITSDEDGIDASTDGNYSDITIFNSGRIRAEDNSGIEADTDQYNSDITITNKGDLTVITPAGDYEGNGISAETEDDYSQIDITNSGDIDVTASGYGYGIYAYTGDDNDGGDSPIVIDNSGDIFVTAGDSGYGIDAYASDEDSRIVVTNSGDIEVTASGPYAYGINADTDEEDSPVTVDNSGDISVTGGEFAYGIDAFTDGFDSRIRVTNSGAISVTGNDSGVGIEAGADDADSPVTVTNSGDIAVTAGRDVKGIYAYSFDENSPVTVTNSGDITAMANAAGEYADGIDVETEGDDSAATITNSGDITVRGVEDADALDAFTLGENSAITIVNSGDLDVRVSGAVDQGGRGIDAEADGANSPVSITNSGSVYATTLGVYSYSTTSTTIANLAGGAISAGSNFAIQVDGGPATIMNAGTVTGFIDLTDNADSFTNQNGGLFQATDTSDFGGGDDVFTNEEGGTVDTADDPSAEEDVRFVEIERFENFGTISLVDGAPGDLFTIADTLGGTGLDYIAGSTLAVDAFLGSPNTGRSDIFRIDGDVSGKTDVVVNVTGTEDAANAKGITVVQVRGSVDEDAFRLRDGPIETGFFVFDLFFEEDGAAFDEFELRSFAGPGAFLLPQLVTAAQDIWHETSDTWFDRSADLRSFFFAQPYAAAPVYTGGKDLGGVVALPSPTGGPAVWARGSGAWIDRDETVRTEAFGRDFKFNLDNELHVADFQAGVDIHRRGVLSPGDVLLLTAFGGAVWADLDFDKIARRFDYEGGQAGAAATYLNGGLFIDALFNAQFLEIEPEAFGFGPDFDADTYGFRVDSGYRFGFTGFFLEPLLTISYAESDLDGFTVGPNRVTFGDEHSLRGRVGLRAGTVWDLWGVRAEPYVIASLWSELDDDDNRARLTSNGTSFTFEDENEDSWGEVSFGSHYYLFGNNAVSAFTKTDIAFGDDYDAYAFKGGFRVNW